MENIHSIYSLCIMIYFSGCSIEKLRMTFTTRYYISRYERVRYIVEAGMTVANKAVSDDSGSVSVSGLVLRRREVLLKNINRSEKREALLLPFLSRFSRIAPFWCHVTNCFCSPVIIFPVEDGVNARERERRREADAIRTRWGKKSGTG